MKIFRVAIQNIGFAEIEANSEDEALDIAEDMDESQFTWGEAGDPMIVEVLGECAQNNPHEFTVIDFNKEALIGTCVCWVSSFGDVRTGGPDGIFQRISKAEAEFELPDLKLVELYEKYWTRYEGSVPEFVATVNRKHGIMFAFEVNSITWKSREKAFEVVKNAMEALFAGDKKLQNCEFLFSYSKRFNKPTAYVFFPYEERHQISNFRTQASVGVKWFEEKVKQIFEEDVQ